LTSENLSSVKDDEVKSMFTQSFWILYKSRMFSNGFVLLSIPTGINPSLSKDPSSVITLISDEGPLVKMVNFIVSFM
jgi:hypothetical protein